MEKADNPVRPARQSSVDLLIVGGGIMGLWAAVHAERMGIDTLVVEAARLGGGASGGLLGALMPHMPDRWSEKKQFQFDALVSLEAAIAELESVTGLSAQYRRAGRLIPLPKEHLRRIALGHSRDAEEHWHDGDRRFHWHVLDAPPVSGWIDPTAGVCGFVYDTLAARVAPRSLLSVLSAYLHNAKHVQVLERMPVDHIDPRDGVAFARDRAIHFGSCILSAGHHSFPLLDGQTSGLRARLGQPVKGQAALLKADVDPALPVIFRDGLYVVPHEHGLVAVGSTSENRFDDPVSTDEQLDQLIAMASDMVPALRDAKVVERWAGLRPKAIDRDPMAGRHPEHPRLLALTGGFKVSFGLAHRLAAAVVADAGGMTSSIRLPAGFSLVSHIGVASRIT